MVARRRRKPSRPGAIDIDAFMAGLIHRNPGEPEFHQAVHEVANDVIPFMNANPRYEPHLLERLTEPDRVLTFRVCWEDDAGNVRVNRGTRVQWSNTIGPYKGGLRFHPSVTLSVLKFLGFEQTFKNSLTGLPMGGAKGGANFNPRGKSDREVMRFCQAFMTELFRHIGPNTDIPAGDIGVGAREISFLFGQYKRIANEFTGTLTGKGLAFGGSLIRAEATGYGLVYFAEEMLKRRGDGFAGKTCVVSGAGNVAQYTTEKINALGGKVVTLSDSNGFVYDEHGIDAEKLAWVMELKSQRRGRIGEYVERWGGEYHEGGEPWDVPCDMAFPCATQNEIDGAEARTLVNNGIMLLAEGANMPSTLEAIRIFRTAGILYAPSKAANAGGVAVSGLEQTQNAMRLSWTRARVDDELRQIMTKIHDQCVKYGVGEGGDGTGDGDVDYVRGANVGGFVKVADAMMSYGVL